MPINFPISPSTDDTYTYLTKTWKYNGTAWERSAATETGNVEGNTGELAYYYAKGSNIQGATAFFYAGDKIGIGTSGPTETLDVRGGITASDKLYAAGGATLGNQLSVGTTVIKTAGIYDSPLGLLLLDSGTQIAQLSDTGFIFNLNSTDIDFSVRGDVLTNLLYVNAGTNNVGINTNAPAERLHVVGGGHFTTGVTASSLTVSGVGGITASYNSHFSAGITCDKLEVGGYWAGTHEEIIGISIDNGNETLTTGKKGRRVIPYNCEVTDWTVISEDTGSITWDVNWCTYANWPTTASVGMHASETPLLDGANKNTSPGTIPNGKWTKRIFDAGDIIEFEIDSVSSITNCNLAIKIRRTG